MQQFLFAQIPVVGGWRDHFDFKNIFSVYKRIDNRIYCASQNGFMIINSDGSTEKLTKVNGLCEVGITAVSYFENLDAFVVGYSNGNIDLIFLSQIINIPDLKRKNISADKKIYSITNYGNFAYLACGFGIIKLDVENSEITDTYFIGQNSMFTKVNNIAFLNDSIFAATDDGIYSASLNSFLAESSNWHKLNIGNITVVKQVLSMNKDLVCLGEDNSSSIHLIIKKSDNQIIDVLNNFRTDAKIFVQNDNIFLTNYDNYFIYDKNGILTKTVSSLGGFTYFLPNYIGFDSKGKQLIGTSNIGVIIQNNDNYSSYSFSGVYSNQVKKVAALNNFVVATRGGNTETINHWYKGTFSIFKDGLWTTKMQDNSFDFNCIALDTNNKGHFFIGSFGTGVYEYQENELLNHWDYTNSPLESLIDNSPYIWVSDIKFDKNNNLWVFNAAQDNPVNVLKPDKTWVSFTMNNLFPKENTRQIILTSSGLFYGIVKGKGFVIMSDGGTLENKDDDIIRLYYPIDEVGERIGSEIYSLAEGKDGSVWFGTDAGVGVFYSPENFNNSDFGASRIKVTDLTNDTLNTGYLLKTEKVLSIAIDGGDRKWLGTENSGVYLMNSTCSKQLAHFDSKNSPLPDNKINSIAIDPKTGEVFFATDGGVVSYRAEGTEAGQEFGEVYVFPNPVKHEYSGLITITGLAKDVNVKITDIAGNIVYETTSIGGQATWTGNSFSGSRVATGVYLVFCTNDDGSATFVTKILFVK